MIEKREIFKPDWISPPGDTITDLLDERGWTQEEFAKRMGYTPKHISLLINGKASITQDTAMRLECVLGSSAGFWLTREAQFCESKARLEEMKNLESGVPWAKSIPIKDLMKCGAIEKCRVTKSNEPKIVKDMLQFFCVASPTDWKNQYESRAVAYRRTKEEQSNVGAISAWLRLGEIEAEKLDVPKYDMVKFENNLRSICALTTQSLNKFNPILTKLCLDAGVIVVFIPSIPGAHVSGAVHWLNKKQPIIQLSFYGKTNDRFWFTFFHEAVHVLKHGKDMVFLDELEGQRLESDEEREADQIAGDYLIPKEMQTELKNLRSKMAVLEFAQKLGIHPGIVVGRMQHERVIPYTHMNALKEHYEFTYTRITAFS